MIAKDNIIISEKMGLPRQESQNQVNPNVGSREENNSIPIEYLKQIIGQTISSSIQESLQPVLNAIEANSTLQSQAIKAIEANSTQQAQVLKALQDFLEKSQKRDKLFQDKQDKL